MLSLQTGCQSVAAQQWFPHFHRRRKSSQNQRKTNCSLFLASLMLLCWTLHDAVQPHPEMHRISAISLFYCTVVVKAQQLLSSLLVIHLHGWGNQPPHPGCRKSVSCVGCAGQSNRCSTECGATPKPGQTSVIPDLQWYEPSIASIDPHVTEQE